MKLKKMGGQLPHLTPYAFKVGVTETCIVGVGMLSEDIKMSISVMIWIDLV